MGDFLFKFLFTCSSGYLNLKLIVMYQSGHVYNQEMGSSV